jgi:hypothetical protein
MTTRWARVARGFVAAVISLFVAAFGHVISGGNTPSLFALVACLVLSTFACVVLCGKELSLLRLSASVILSQFLFHAIFSASAVLPALGHSHDHLLTIVSSSGAGTAISIDDGMWAGHGVAAAMTIVALRYGELAFWGLLTIARPWICTIFAAIATSRPGAMMPVIAPVERMFLPSSGIRLLSPMRHRGPPSVAIATAQ